MRIAYGLLIMIGLAIMGIGIDHAVVTHRFLGHAQRAYGKVVGQQQRVQQGRHGGTYIVRVPIVEFSANEKVIRFVNPATLGSAATGQTVAILYDPDNPDNATLDGFSALWANTFITLTLGTVITLFLLCFYPSFIAGVNVKTKR